jgi:putative FmdB family regulatory protein
MPIHAYRCASCGYEKDALQKLSDAPLTRCPECGQETFSKQVTAAGFQLKGSGWYVTDFRGGNSGGAPAKPAGEAAAPAADAGGGAAPAGGGAAPAAATPAAASSGDSTGKSGSGGSGSASSNAGTASGGGTTGAKQS